MLKDIVMMPIRFRCCRLVESGKGCFTVETVVRAQRHCNDADKVSMLSVG